MKTAKNLLLALSLVATGLFGLLSSPVLAADDNCVETNLFGTVCDDGNGDGVYLILNVVLTVMTFGIGILGTIGIVVAGIQYATAKDNDQQVAKAKMRIAQVVIGMAIWAVLYLLIRFFMPGGIQ